ncbi:MAG: hypothetical protein ACJ75R_03270 [Solirubrobacterales bacterium]
MADLLLSWVAWPLVLVLVCAGCGLLVRSITRDRIDPPLVPVVGLAAAIVVGEFLTVAGATAPLTMPVIVGLAVVGLALTIRRRPGWPHPWPFVAGAVTFAILAAPIVLSGQATVAGFIKLDDTASWLAFTDRVMDHGRDLDGLPWSTYEATLRLNVGDGYPIGAFIPLGVGSKLLATDPAWLIQPYMATLGALLSLGLWSLATPLAASSRLRALAAAIGSVSALLVGYYLWGGLKEIAAAALIAATAALAVRAVAAPRRPERLFAPAIAAAALVGVLSAGAVLWLLPILLPAAALLGARVGGRAAAVRSVAVALGVGVLSVPTLIAGGIEPPTSSPLGDSAALGNLLRPIDPLQLAGIWGAGDFRLPTDDGLLVTVLIAVAVVAAVAGITWAVARRDIGPALFVLGMLAGCALIAAFGSPWVDGKALATASVAIPFAAMVGVGWLASSRRRAAAAVVGAAVAGGVLWSNALAYRDVSLAPRGQLAELHEIGDRVSGQGPTLITEYSPYAARHFLREADPESISELRRRPIELRDGSEVPKGDAVDTDRIDPAALDVYRTLVIRRSPAASRPPAAYHLIWRGEYYEAWQRGPEATPPLDDLRLGSPVDPVAVPACPRVRSLARSAPRGSSLVASWIPEPVIAKAPPALPVDASVAVRRSGTYRIWLEGSAMPALNTSVDGEPVGTVRGQLSNRGGYIDLGAAHLARGRHRIEIDLDEGDLHPGSGGAALTTGRIALSTADAADARLIRVDPADAHRLCGRRLDWIEQVGSSEHQ